MVIRRHDADRGCASADTRSYRKLATRRGDYFVRWAPEHVTALLCAEALRPEDFLPDDPARRHRLVKDLFLLGLKDELGRGRPSVITRFARAMMRRTGLPRVVQGPLAQCAG
jgi:hypothetical protein